MFIHNISTEEQTYKGQSVEPDEFYAIPPEKLSFLAQDEKLLVDIANGLAAISVDGSTDLVDKNLMINTLKGLFLELSDKSSIQGAISVINLKPEEESFARATHDFCNKTTWYTNSVRVEGEILSNPVGLVYTCANEFLIDVIGGNINRQDTLQQYAIKVYDAGVEITNYTVDSHREGKIILGASPSGAVTVDYSYATDSTWVLEPAAGRNLIMDHSEVQFSIDVEMNTPLRFEIWVYNPYYAEVGHQYEGLVKIPYQTVQYNSIKDLVNEANLGTGTIPAIGNLPECVVFPFNYASIKPMASSQGVELRIRAVGDEELTGSFGTATFYLISRNEE